jgi:hypothetical protein
MSEIDIIDVSTQNCLNLATQAQRLLADIKLDDPVQFLTEKHLASICTIAKQEERPREHGQRLRNIRQRALRIRQLLEGSPDDIRPSFDDVGNYVEHIIIETDIAL